MSLIQLLQDTVSGLDECVQAPSSNFPSPVLVATGSHSAFRHSEEQQTDFLLPYLKVVKIASANNAAIVLLREGFVHETYALCRMIDEASEDVWFMSTPLSEDGNPSGEFRRHRDLRSRSEASDRRAH